MTWKIKQHKGFFYLKMQILFLNMPLNGDKDISVLMPFMFYQVFFLAFIRHKLMFILPSTKDKGNHVLSISAQVFL